MGNKVRVNQIGQALLVSEVNDDGLVVNSIVVPPKAIGIFLDDLEKAKQSWREHQSQIGDLIK